MPRQRLSRRSPARQSGPDILRPLWEVPFGPALSRSDCFDPRLLLLTETIGRQGPIRLQSLGLQAAGLRSEYCWPSKARTQIYKSRRIFLCWFPLESRPRHPPLRLAGSSGLRRPATLWEEETTQKPVPSRRTYSNGNE